jgi:hypothetical protein
MMTMTMMMTTTTTTMMMMMMSSVARLVGFSEFPEPTFSDVSPPVICPFVYTCSRMCSAGP